MIKPAIHFCTVLILAICRWSVAQDAIIGGAPEPTDPETRMRSWDRHVELHTSSAFKDLEWRVVGPRKQGGRIEAIAVAPGKPGTIYVGPGSGNLWKTTNNGTTWRPIFEKESTFAIGDVAVAPSNPDIVWVGTGEVLMARSSYAGTGVFKSTDAGETWRNMGLTDTHHIGKILVDPVNPDVVYVAAIGHLYSSNQERGLFKTTDGGRTWTRSLYIDEWTGVIDLVMDPSDRDTLYATSWERSRRAWGHTWTGSQSGVWKTSDGGENWRRLEGGLPSGEQVGRIAVDVSFSNPSVVYALVGGQGEARGVFRSDDKGETWIQVNQEKVAVGYDFCIIKISPDNENEIYLPGQRTVRSTDGGKTYRQIEGTLVHLLEHGSRVLHLDAHELWIDPSNADHLLLGNDGGFHVSYDRGQAWLHFNNLPIGEFYAVSVDMQTPYNIYGGNQDNAALFGPSNLAIQDDLEDPWTQIYLDRWGGGDSYFTHVDPTDPQTIYYEYQFGDFRRKNMETGQNKRIQPRARQDEEPLRYNWMTPYVISKFNPYTLYYGANKMFKSLDRGAAWHSLCANLPTTPVYDLIVHPRDDELIIGTHGRSIFVLDTQSIQSDSNQ